MIFFGLVGVFIVFVAERKLKSTVAIGLDRLHLCHYTGTRFDDRAGSLFTRGIEDARHSDLFPNNTFHFLQFMPAGLLGQRRSVFYESRPVRVLRTGALQSPFATDLFFYSEVPAVNKP